MAVPFFRRLAVAGPMLILLVAAAAGLPRPSAAQTPQVPPAVSGWQPASGGTIRRPAAAAALPANDAAPAAEAPSAASPDPPPPRGTSAVRVTSGTGTLPNDHGQLWREYDISPYTSRVRSTNKPEQAIVDWILRETGTEVWFSDPLGILNASRSTLRVYHTAPMQQLVTEVVERFVRSEAQSYAFTVRLVTVASPNWRTTAVRNLRPVTVQTPGIEAWLLNKEDAAVLLNDLRRRTDYREHNASNVVIHNGQSAAIAMRRPMNYTRGVFLRPEAWPGYELQTGMVEEGFTLEISPLMSLDGLTTDMVIKCEVDQVEKLAPVWIDVPTAAAPRQRVQVQVPQMVSWRLHERFRWPSDQVLLLSCGVVATPGPGKATANITLPALFESGPPRADGLLLLEAKGKTSAVPEAASPATTEIRAATPDYRGRY